MEKSDVTYKSEFYPSREHPKNLYDIFGIRFGVNSQTSATETMADYDLCRCERK